MLIGALGVHTGRGVLVPSRDRASEVASVHTYLSWFVPAVCVALALVISYLVVRFARETRADVPQLPRARTLWMISAASMLCIVGVQEVVEAAVSGADVPSLGSLLGHGGWTIIPLAAAFGGGFALLLRGVVAVARWVIARRRAVDPRGASGAVAVPAVHFAVPRSVLSGCGAGRAPPGLA